MIIYIVYPLGTDAYEPRAFEDPYDAIMWEDELAMMGIKTESEMRETYCAA